MSDSTRTALLAEIGELTLQYRTHLDALHVVERDGAYKAARQLRKNVAEAEKALDLAIAKATKDEGQESC